MALKILEGVCRPLKIRLEQILVAEPGPVALYKLVAVLSADNQEGFLNKIFDFFQKTRAKKLQTVK